MSKKITTTKLIHTESQYEKFLKWLKSCKCNYTYMEDDYGVINISFSPTDLEWNEDEEEA